MWHSGKEAKVSASRGRQSFPRELWGVVGQASGLPPGFGVSVGLGSTDFLVCQACTRGLGALQVSHIPVPDIAAPSFFFFPPSV